MWTSYRFLETAGDIKMFKICMLFMLWMSIYVNIYIWEKVLNARREPVNVLGRGHTCSRRRVERAS